MKRTVYIYEKNKESLAFLEKFFTGNNNYDASFFSNIRLLRKALKSEIPDALVLGAPDCVDTFGTVTSDYAVVGVASPSDPESAVNSMVSNNVRHYIVPPFQDYDFEGRLDIALRDCTKNRHLTQERQDLESIYDMTYMLSSTLNPQELLYIIVKKLSEIMPVTRCSILSIDFSGSKTAEVVSSFENPSIKISLDLIKYPEITRALRTKKPVVIKDAALDPIMEPVRATIEPLKIKSIIVVPVMFRSEVIGTLFLRTTRKEHFFTEREVRLCQAIANVSANALNNAFLFHEVESQRAELERLSITDFLTGVYNVRYLYHRLESEFSRAERYNLPLSCVMMDIDFFKKVNDTYGHRVGDIVLREFATLVKARSRKSDVFARYGGEEFILVLPQSGLKGAVSEANRIREIVRKHRFKGLRKDDKITISLGVSSFPDKRIKSQDDLISLADNALLAAKGAGRNQVITDHR